MTDLSKLAAERCAECERITAERDAALAHAERLAGALGPLINVAEAYATGTGSIYADAIDASRAALASWQERAGVADVVRSVERVTDGLC